MSNCFLRVLIIKHRTSQNLYHVLYLRRLLLVPLSVVFQIDGEVTEVFNLTSDTEFNSVKSLSVGRVQGKWWLCSSEICSLWTCCWDLCKYIHDRLKDFFENNNNTAVRNYYFVHNSSTSFHLHRIITGWMDKVMQSKSFSRFY